MIVHHADYNEKAVDAVDYGDIDEEYDGPEVQVVTEEDHLLAKREYFSSAAASGSLYSKASVFDDDDYDEEEEQEVEHMQFEESFDSEDSESGLLSKLPFVNKIFSRILYFWCVIQSLRCLATYSL